MIHVVIPVHNRWPQTRDCLLSLQAQTHTDVAVYVVDDGSTDGTAESIENEFPTVRVVKGSGDLWWTGAMRLGVEFALRNAAADDCIMAVNNDVVMPRDTLASLHDFVKANPGSIANALSLDLSDKDTVISSGSRVISWVLNISVHPRHGRSYAKIDKKPIQVDTLNGRSTIFPRAVFDENGNFDSIAFPHYAGDIEFTLRAGRNGWRLYLLPSVVVYLNQRTTGLNPTAKYLSLREMLKSFFSIRSSSNLVTRTRFAFRCCPWYAVPTYTLIMYVKIVLQAVIGNTYVRLSQKSSRP